MFHKKIVKSYIESHQTLGEKKENLHKFINLIESDDKAVLMKGLLGIRKLVLRDSQIGIQEIMASGIFTKILEIFKWNDEAKLQFLGGWVINKICSEKSERIAYSINQGVLPALVQAFNSSNENVVEQAISTVANIAKTNLQYRNMCINQGFMDQVISAALINPENKTLLKNSLQFIRNILKQKPMPEWVKVAQAMPLLKKGIEHFEKDDDDEEDQEPLINALWSLSWISVNHIQEVIDLDCVSHLIIHLKNNNFSIMYPALRVLANLVAGNDSQTNIIVNHLDFLPRIFDLALNSEKKVRKEACWLISNIAAGNESQIEMIVCNFYYIGVLKKVLTQDSIEVSNEAAWTLCNLATGASTTQISQLVNGYNYLRCLNLIFDNPDSKIKQNGLEAALNVLQAGENVSGENPYLKNFVEDGLVELIQIMAKKDEFANLGNQILEFFKDLEETDYSSSNSSFHHDALFFEKDICPEFVRED